MIYNCVILSDVNFAEKFNRENLMWGIDMAKRGKEGDHTLVIISKFIITIKQSFELCTLSDGAAE